MADHEREPAETATIWVDEEQLAIDDATTAVELKDMVGADQNHVLAFRGDEGQLKQLPADEPVLDYVNSGAELRLHPVSGRLF